MLVSVSVFLGNASYSTETADANGNKETTTTVSKFEDKIESSSAKMYFHYYGQLLHQQNMMQDYVRTGTYYAAVIENQADFQGRVVVDVGAGSGILSLFAAQASTPPKRCCVLVTQGLSH
jgi:2-polyprenyl-3-methyl-5-hydroxy-6-metoxy-1,4-benzoquinol methylase